MFSSSVSPAATGSAREMLRQANRLYGDRQFAEAVNKYNDALVEQPQAVEPKFNKANSYYRLDDLSAAMDLYQEVAAQSKDMSLVARAKYNLGNCFFQRGTKQRDSSLQKALEDMQTGIANWRQVLDLDPKNTKAAKNIAVARLTIKDILDQQKRQKQQDPNQSKQPQPPQNPSPSKQDPNQPQGGQGSRQEQKDPNDAHRSGDADPARDPNQAVQKDQAEEPVRPQDSPPPDLRAQEIIDNEQAQKKGRESLQQRQYREVEKDW